MGRVLTTLSIFIGGILASCSSASPDDPSAPSKIFLKFGTGSQTGVYYAAGLAVAEFLNEGTETHGLDAAVESTDGSVFNLNAVMQGEIDFGFVQADRQFQAVKGLEQWKGTPQEDLRYICSFHSEAVTLVAAVDSAVNLLPDMRGRRVSIGSPGSGTRGNAEAILGRLRLVPERDFDAEELKASEASMMLQDGRIDAFFYTVGHPNGLVTEATNGRREVRLVPITAMESLIDRAPYYSKLMIPHKLYPRAANTADIPSIGMRTTLVTHRGVSDEVVHEVTRAIFENFERLKQRHPTFSGLTIDQMFEAQFAPIHSGALKYYREKGYL